MGTNRELAAKYLDELENMCLRIEGDKEFTYTDVLATVRACYWLFREYLRLEERYDEAVKKLNRNNSHS